MMLSCDIVGLSFLITSRKKQNNMGEKNVKPYIKYQQSHTFNNLTVINMYGAGGGTCSLKFYHVNSYLPTYSGFYFTGLASF